MNRIFKEMPKLDLHCHLDGSMGLDITKELLKELGRDYETEELKTLLQVPEDCTSLAEYLKRFDLPIQCIQTTEGLRKAAFDLARSAAEENVKYLEVRFAPSFSTAGGLSIREILESVDKGLKQAEKEADIRTGIIVCGMRGTDMETNLKMLKESREMLGAGVVACDLAGDEKSYPTAEFAEFFREAKRLEMPFTIHAGECGSTQNIRDAVELGAKRIGHGIAMAADPELIRLCAGRHVGVEICPTSNFQTKAAVSWETYPFRTFLDGGVPLSVNTDNRTVSGTDSTGEFEKLAEHFDVTEEDLKKIYEASVEMAFADDDSKEQLLGKWSI